MLLLMLLSGCAADPADTCSGFQSPVEAGTVNESALDEASGLVTSGVHPDVLWTHNDSGDTARLYAIDATGSSVGELTLAGAIPEDWEDITRSGVTLFVGDIGDNDQDRAKVAIWRVEEPDTLGPDGSAGSSRLLLSYPSGPQDAEALVHHGESLWILTKDAEGAGVYEVDPTLDEQQVQLVDILTVPAELPAGDAVTAADTDGVHLFVRTESSVLVYTIQDDIPGTLSGAPCILPAPDGTDGESIAAFNGGFATLSEGRNPALWLTESS